MVEWWVGWLGFGLWSIGPIFIFYLEEPCLIIRMITTFSVWVKLQPLLFLFVLNHLLNEDVRLSF
jgi:hypothetical protein